MRFKFLFFHFLFFNLIGAQASAQELYAINVTWSDSYAEWSFITADEEEGSFRHRWLGGGDWSEWVFDFEDRRGSFKIKWNDDPNSWELRVGGEVVNLRTKWKNDFSEWRISSGPINLNFRSTYNQISEWHLLEKKYGAYSIQIERENDPRDWNIYDDLDENISLELKLAMTFIAIVNSVPR